MNGLNGGLINPNIRANLQVMSSVLTAHSSLLVSDSLSSINSNPVQQQSHPEIRCYYPLIRSLLSNLNNPFKILPLYSRLLMVESGEWHHVEQMFHSTLFNQRVFWLLTHYLYDETSYLQMAPNAQKIVDVFYKFICSEHPQLMEERLKEGNLVNIGKWFYEEGLQKMFRKYYFTAHDFTVLLSNFMLNGLAVLFVAAICVLGKKDMQEQLRKVDTVRLVYVKKYELE